MSSYPKILLMFFCLGQEMLPAFTPPTVVWDSPSADALGSMPLGNGDIALAHSRIKMKVGLI